MQNEVNNRATPTLVGFGKKQRVEGDAAQSVIKSNLKNTVRYFNHLLARVFSRDKEAIDAQSIWSLCPLCATENDEVP